MGTERKQRKVGKIQTAVLLRTLFPVLLLGALMAFLTYRGYRLAIREESKPVMQNVAETVATQLDEAYPGDYYLVGEEIVSLYKGDTDITLKYDVIDEIKEKTGMDVTLFYENTRIMTTLADGEGNRYVATGVNATIYNEMEEVQAFLYYDVALDNAEYYSCYMPLHNADGGLVGMVAVARPADYFSEKAWDYMTPIFASVAAGLVFTGLFVWFYTGKMLGDIRSIREFLERMTNGELSNPMNKSVLKREDELGDVGKTLVDMQSAMRILVERDALTSLYNRRHGAVKLKSVVKKSQKQGIPFALALGDIDFFKKVNDTYGHEAGDIVLKKVSEVMRRKMVGKGFVARWGGEEFLLVFREADEAKGTALLRDLLEEIRKTVITYEEQEIRVTMTFGIVPGDLSDDYGELLRSADEKLYHGKEHGRNRIISRFEAEECGETEPITADVAEEAESTEGVVLGIDLASSDIVERMLQKTAEEIKAE